VNKLNQKNYIFSIYYRIFGKDKKKERGKEKPNKMTG
jgi:hypothetical protein